MWNPKRLISKKLRVEQRLPEARHGEGTWILRHNKVGTSNSAALL
jgi:hypothetical protein